MILTVPITGEFISPTSGNVKNPIRPISFHKLLPEGMDNFAWKALEWDFAKDLVTLEVTFSPSGKAIAFDAEGNPTAWRMETTEEFEARKAASEKAILLALKDKKVDEIYAKTGEAKLIKPR